MLRPLPTSRVLRNKSASGDDPVERDSPRIAIEMCRDAGARTLTTVTLKHIAPDSRFAKHRLRAPLPLGYDLAYDGPTVEL